MLEPTPAAEPVARTPGQDIFNKGQVFPADAIKAGSKSDTDSYARSKDLVYRRKIQLQKKAKKAS